jgi:hypothetical protein
LGGAGRVAKSFPRFNKATIYSWVIFVARAMNRLSGEVFNTVSLARFLHYFEEKRALFSALGLQGTMAGLPEEWLFTTYQDRSTSRVADVSSVVLRDVVIWLVFSEYMRQENLPSQEILDQLTTAVASSNRGLEEDAFARAAIDAGWGELL